MVIHTSHTSLNIYPESECPLALQIKGYNIRESLVMFRNRIKEMKLDNQLSTKQQAVLNLVSEDELELEELRMLLMGGGAGPDRVPWYSNLPVSAILLWSYARHMILAGQIACETYSLAS